MGWAQGPRKRFDRLLRLIEREDLDLAVVSDPKNVYYFTGFTTSAILFLPTYLVISNDGKSTLVTGATDRSVAEKTFGGAIETFTNYDLNETMLAYPDRASGLTAKVLSRYRNGRHRKIGVEGWSFPQALLGEVPKDAEFTDLSPIIQNFRMVNDADEIEYICKSCEVDDLAYSVAKENSKPGMTEVDIYGLAQYELAKSAGTFQFFSGNFTSGERGLDPMGTGEPTMRVMKAGETIVLDLWVTTKGYWADTTRTFVVGGKPTADQLRVHRVLMEALKKGEEKLRPGMKASDVYHAVSEVIDEAGWRSTFTHHAGHAVGLDAWERPFLIPGSEDILKEGMVCALEPGVYLPEVGGIRIENDYLIKKNGAASLSHFPLDL